MLKRFSLLVSGCALAALGSGCFIDTDIDDPAPTGSGDMTLLWTVDNTVDPGACDFYALDPATGMDLEMVLFDDAGRTVLQDYVPCENFGHSVRLRSGWYHAEVTMVDPITNEPLSTTLPLEDIRVVRDTEVELDVDFPASSFLF
jgi:hypothetical protein